MSVVAAYLADLQRVLALLPRPDIDWQVDRLRDAWASRSRVILFGNGGSASLASHFASDLGRTTIESGRPRLRAMALTDNVPLITAWANDAGYATIFVEQLANLMEPGDLVIAISASGNSENVLRGVEYARLGGAMTVAWTGRTGGRLKALAHRCLSVDTDDVEQIEDAHAVLHHVVVRALAQGGPAN